MGLEPLAPWHPGHPGLQLPRNFLSPPLAHLVQGPQCHLQVGSLRRGQGPCNRQPPPTKRPLGSWWHCPHPRPRQDDPGLQEVGPVTWDKVGALETCPRGGPGAARSPLAGIWEPGFQEGSHHSHSW